MKLIQALIAATLFAGVSPVAAGGDSRTATFTVENMTCATCPIAVRKAMQRVDGVKEVAVDMDAKSATVTFDATLTSAEQIAAASTNIGFPATVLPQ